MMFPCADVDLILVAIPAGKGEIIDALLPDVRTPFIRPLRDLMHYC